MLAIKFCKRTQEHSVKKSQFAINKILGFYASVFSSLVLGNFPILMAVKTKFVRFCTNFS